MGSEAPMMNRTWSGDSAIVDHRDGSSLEPQPVGRSGEKAEWKKIVQEGIEDFQGEE